jgi:hypothetical protein
MASTQVYVAAAAPAAAAMVKFAAVGAGVQGHTTNMASDVKTLEILIN